MDYLMCCNRYLCQAWIILKPNPFFILVDSSPWRIWIKYVKVLLLTAKWFGQQQKLKSSLELFLNSEPVFCNHTSLIWKFLIFVHDESADVP
jgi:hypothetical protein